MKRIFLLPLALLATASCASNVTGDKHEQNDTLEGFNRAMFSFNYNVDKYVLKPVAQGYRAITNQDVRNRVNSAFANITEPVSAANQLLQGEVKQSGVSLGRFVINTTLGLGGTFDVATGWGLEKKYDNFERTLAKWCVKDGPYIVLPFIGPSTPRSLAGNIADTFASPVYWLTTDREDGIYAYSAFIAARTIAFRESALDLTDDLERNSVDYYTTMKSAYMQNKAQIQGCYNKENKNASYDFDFGQEEEDATFNEMEN